MDAKREKQRRTARDIRLVVSGLLMESLLGLERWWVWVILFVVCTVICTDWDNVTWKFWRLQWIRVTLGFVEVPTHTNRETIRTERLRVGKRAYMALPEGDVSRVYFVEVPDSYIIRFPGQPLWREVPSEGGRRYRFPAAAGADDQDIHVNLIVARA